MEPLAVVLIILGVLLSVLMVWIVKQRGNEIARYHDKAERQLGFWQTSAKGPRSTPWAKTSAPIKKEKPDAVGEKVCSALRELGVEARLVKEGPSAYGGQYGGHWVIEIAQGPISEVSINYSPAMWEGATDDWEVKCLVPHPYEKPRVLTDHEGLFQGVQGRWTNPSHLKPVWNELQQKAINLPAPPPWPVPPKAPAIPPTPSVTERLCGALQELGIDARLSMRWNRPIEIAEGPIRWVNVDQTDPYDDPDKYSIGWEVPDSRMEPDFPTIAIRSVRAKRIPLIGAVKEVRWEPYQSDPDFEDFEVAQRDLDFSSYVADRLSQDKDVTDAIILYGKEIRISADPEDGYWILGKEWRLSRSALADRAHHYECYRTVAKALLAMPMPTGE